MGSVAEYIEPKQYEGVYDKLSWQQVDVLSLFPTLLTFGSNGRENISHKIIIKCYGEMNYKIINIL